MLGKRRFRAVADDRSVAPSAATCARPATCSSTSPVLVVLAGFAVGSLLGYKGGVIVVEGNGFSNNLTQYDDFVPGSLMSGDDMEPFSFDVDYFDVEWLTDGPRKGMAQKFVANLTYRETPDARGEEYPLKVNHPLSDRRHRGLPDRPRLRAA